MKVRLRDLTRTHLGFPSEWKGKSVDDLDITCSFRHGTLKIYINETLLLQTYKDEWDIGGYLSDEDLELLLRKHELLEE